MNCWWTFSFISNAGHLRCSKNIDIIIILYTIIAIDPLASMSMIFITVVFDFPDPFSFKFLVSFLIWMVKINIKAYFNLPLPYYYRNYDDTDTHRKALFNGCHHNLALHIRDKLRSPPPHYTFLRILFPRTLYFTNDVVNYIIDLTVLAALCVRV